MGKLGKAGGIRTEEYVGTAKARPSTGAACVVYTAASCFAARERPAVHGSGLGQNAWNLGGGEDAWLDGRPLPYRWRRP